MTDELDFGWRWQLWRIKRFIGDYWAIWWMEAETRPSASFWYRFRWARLWALYGWEVSAEVRSMHEEEDDD